MVAAIGARQERDGIRGNVAEIGVHHGKLFILLYLLTKADERGVAIDLFSLQHLNIDRSGKGNLARFLTNLRCHADTDRVIVHEGDSTALDGAMLVRLGGGPFRLISIDGGHTAEITLADLRTAESALAPGGVVILDDCFNESWPGVSEGVHRYFSESPAVVPFAIGGNKVLFCRAASVATYVDALRAAVPKRVDHSFLGSPVVYLDFSPFSWAEYIGRQRWWGAMRETPFGHAFRSIYKLAVRR
jgi:Methyltransferase domain